MHERWIPRGAAGTRVTLETMQMLALQGNQDILLPSVVRGLVPRTLDAWMRGVWDFEPEAVETLRTIDHMLSVFARSGFLVGDCDDAAVFAAAAMLVMRRDIPGAILHCNFLAVRSIESIEFTHVFAVGQDWRGYFFVDPTAPLDANYRGMEPMVVSVF